MNVTVTLAARGSVAVALSARYAVAALVVLFYHVVMTLRAAHLGELVFVRYLGDIDVTVRTGKITMDGLFETLPVDEERNDLTVSVFF
jgi:hypothetical protein